MGRDRDVCKSLDDLGADAFVTWLCICFIQMTRDIYVHSLLGWALIQMYL